jgi:hypothetical protein
MSAESARLDDLGPADGARGWCPFSDLTEAFVDAPTAAQWFFGGDACARTENTGTLQFAMSGSGNCIAYLARPYDLRDHAIEAKITSAEQARTRFKVTSDDQRYVASMILEAGQLALDVEVDHVALFTASVAYDPVKDRYWLIRMTGTQVRFEHSADGDAWSAIGMVDAPTFDGTALYLELSADLPQASPNPVLVSFGEVNGS